MLKLAAFADEISPDLDEQIKHCKLNSVRLIELRSVNKINVLDLDKDLCTTIKSKLADAGMAIACIGSPIGKVKIDEPFGPHFDKFKVAVELAGFFGCSLVRLFSYYPPEKGGDMRPHRDEVMKRMAAKVDFVKSMNVTLVHENEAHIYGEKGAECVDLLKTINSPKLRAAFDSANFVVAGEKPIDNWPGLKPFTTHFHIKDALLSTRKVVAAGKGDGDIGPIVADAYKSGYRGLLTLEPHLAAAGQFSGFSGPDLFKVAVDSFREVCAKHSVPLAQ